MSRERIAGSKDRLEEARRLVEALRRETAERFEDIHRCYDSLGQRLEETKAATLELGGGLERGARETAALRLALERQRAELDERRRSDQDLNRRLLESLKRRIDDHEARLAELEPGTDG